MTADKTSNQEREALISSGRSCEMEGDARLNHALLNSTTIATELSTGPFLPRNYVEHVARAALILADIEMSRPDYWEDAPRDWESTCAFIADFIAVEGKAPSREDITAMIEEIQ